MKHPWIVLLFILAMPAWAQDDNDISEMSAMCSALISIVAIKQPEPAQSIMFTEAQWFVDFTTTEKVELYMRQLQEALNQEWDRVWPLMITGSEHCTSIKAEAIAEVEAGA